MHSKGALHVGEETNERNALLWAGRCASERKGKTEDRQCSGGGGRHGDLGSASRNRTLKRSVASLG